MDGDRVGIGVCGDSVGWEVVGEVDGLGVDGAAVGNNVGEVVGVSVVGSRVVGACVGVVEGKFVPGEQQRLINVSQSVGEKVISQEVRAPAAFSAQACGEPPALMLPSCMRDVQGSTMKKRSSWHPLRGTLLHACASPRAKSAAVSVRRRREKRPDMLGCVVGVVGVG